MSLTEIASYADSLIKLLGLPALIISGVAALVQLILKWRADRISGDVTLVTHFVDLMEVAHARKGKGEQPTGIASQDAAIAAIWQLGCRYRVLRPAAIQGLASLCIFKADIARPYLDNLISRSGKTPYSIPKTAEYAHSE